MRLLAIETSCDETAIAIADFLGPKSGPSIRVLSNIVSSQVKLHAKFGGVVPNLAKREHQKNLVPILLRALREASFANAKIKMQNIKPQPKIQDSLNAKRSALNAILERESELLARFKKNILRLSPPPIDAIAVTYGPGLAPALWVGVNFAKALAYLWRKPLIPVDHMAGHLYSALLQSAQRISNFEIRISKLIQNSKLKVKNLRFPALALLVSGGHTELVLMRGHGKFEILGETLDDAAGEAFDKTARILGLGYPGGPEINREADKTTGPESQKSKVKSQKYNSKLEIKLPRPMINSKDYNFSFSGLKTAVLYLARDLGQKQTKRLCPQIAKKFQDAVVEVLVKKTIRAAKEYGAKSVLLGGGVAANKKLRHDLAIALRNELPHVTCLMSHVALTGDNALMIALAAYFCGDATRKWRSISADANLKLETGKTHAPILRDSA